MFFFLDASFYLCECSHNLSQREFTSARNRCFNQFKDSSHFFLFRVLYVIVDEEQPFFIRVKWISNSYNASSLIMTVFLFQIKKIICWDLNSRFRRCNYSGRRTFLGRVYTCKWVCIYIYIYIVMVYINICVFDMFIV